MLRDDRSANPHTVDTSLAARTVIGVFGAWESAEAAASQLHQAGVPTEQISVIARPPGSAPEMGSSDTHAGAGTAAGAGVGALVGGAIALGSLAVPGLGLLVAAGPIVAALTGAAAGGALGGLLGSIAGLGVPTEHAKRYESAVRTGGVLVSASLPTSADADSAREILLAQGATDVESFTPAL